MGWFGMASQLIHTLKTYGALTDENGDVIITQHPPFRGLDPNEVVVDDKCCCIINGKEVPIVGLMNSTSYGLKVVVL